MRHVRANGYPVPEVFDVDGGDVVMERLDGVTMADDLAARPWRVDRHADTWADLHRRLAAVPVGDLAVEARFGAPDAVLHLDFHPLNIMMTSDGPVVFDWSNAAVGPPAADVALAWIIVATSTIEVPPLLRPVAGRLLRRLVDRFVDSCGRAAAIAILPAVADYRLTDRNTLPEEAEPRPGPRHVARLSVRAGRATCTWRGRGRRRACRRWCPRPSCSSRRRSSPGRRCR